MQITFDINDADDIARVRELLSQLGPGVATAAVVAPAQPAAAPAPAPGMPANVTPMPQQPAAPAPAPAPAPDDAKQPLLAGIRDVCRSLGPAVQQVGQHLTSHYGVANASELSVEQLTELHQWCVNLKAQG